MKRKGDIYGRHLRRVAMLVKSLPVTEHPVSCTCKPCRTRGRRR